MSMILPPERDLPAARFDAIEAELVALVGAPRRRSPWLVPLSAAAAVLLLLIGLAVVLTTRDQPEPSAPAVSAGPSHTRTPSQSPVPTYTPLPSNDRAAIVPGCMESLEPSSLPGPQSLYAHPKLYNLNGTPTNGLALIYTDGEVVFCIIGGNVTAYNPGGDAVTLHWIPAPVRVDYQYESATNDGSTLHAATYFGGRVTSDVKKLTATVAGITKDLSIQNGTFIDKIDYVREIGSKPGRVIIRAYGADGKQLAGRKPKCTDGSNGCARWP